MLENFVERIKQYPAKEQVEMKVRVKVPGSWFPGNLTAEEKRQKYEAQAADWAQAKTFKKVGNIAQYRAISRPILPNTRVLGPP